MQNAGNRIIMLLEAVTLLLKVVFNEFFFHTFLSKPDISNFQVILILQIIPHSSGDLSFLKIL
jgi:hypothetical protein